MTKRDRIEELTKKLKEAARAYYSTGEELMSNYEYDAMYDELVKLEKETGIVLAGSPTQKVGFEVVSQLPKVTHALPMKSLDKTKEPEALAAFLGLEEGMLSWKLDGLTIVLTYENGELAMAATRGNGTVGEVITTNARFFGGVPLKIPYDGHLVVRGEALISYANFERINEKLPPEEQYKNPRNLCSGSVRQLDSRVARDRHVEVLVYTLVESDRDTEEFHDSKEEGLKWLQSLGFTPVGYKMVTGGTVEEAVREFSDEVETMPYPVDGLVLTLNSFSLSASLGETAKFPKDSIAFKWQDETAETTLTEVEWSPSRTGLINPVAIFDPVELEGTTVKRASLHNVSILKELKLGLGDRITVYKANMIIPQIAENLTQSGTLQIPDTCPRCGDRAEVIKREDVEVLYCTNPGCPAKLVRSLSHFVSRQAMNIDGLSEATLERMADEGFLNGFADLYRLKDHREAIEKLDGFGEKSAQKLLDAIEASRHTEMYRVVSGIGIPGIGEAGAKVLQSAYAGDIAALRAAGEEELAGISGIGPVTAAAIYKFFRQEDNQTMLDDLLSFLTIEVKSSEAPQLLKGKTLVITGSLNHFENRDALKAIIEEHGGKVAGSVSKNTDYLVNNDLESTSSKNKKAKELGVPIISEEQLLEIMQLPQ